MPQSNNALIIQRAWDGAVQVKLELPAEDTGNLSYGETQVNLMKASIFKKKTTKGPFNKRVKCSHCLAVFSNRRTLDKHLKTVKQQRDSVAKLHSLSFLSLSEIKKAIYGKKVKSKPEESVEVGVIKDISQGHVEEPNSNPVIQKILLVSEELALDADTYVPPLKAPKQTLFPCPQCSKVFKHNRSLITHSVKHTTNIEMSLCPICGKQFGSPSSLKAHHRAVHENKSYLCQHCSATFNSSACLRRHSFTHCKLSDKKFICELCGKRFAVPALLKTHKISHSDVRPFACRLCGNHFKRASHLNIHIEQVHRIQDGPGKRKFVCEVCDKPMARKHTLELHMKRHFAKKEFQCENCPKRFNTNLGLNIHLSLSKCEPLGERQCTICNKEFKVHDEICEHLKAKEGDTGSTTDMVKALKLGVKQKKDKHFSCILCEKTFIFKCQLKKHFQLAHTDERPFTCGLCPKAFKTKASLRIHEDVHADVREIQCPSCPKRFRMSGHLKIHLRTHTGEKPYVCKVCGRGFSQKGDMKKHLLKTHAHLVSSPL